eukprot:1181913-Pleurochrysis_carterae.AAC.2
MRRTVPLVVGRVATGWPLLYRIVHPIIFIAPGQAGAEYSAMYRSPACPGAPTTFNKVLTTESAARETTRERETTILFQAPYNSYR